jgi:hypothetical protein
MTRKVRACTTTVCFFPHLTMLLILNLLVSCQDFFIYVLATCGVCRNCVLVAYIFQLLWQVKFKI